ncbi:hypothetical protein RE428_27090 [Marinobacter nanhaiticus D15-8W]|nr:hypothetical protein RE428_27090 [Marinobacter nanhaiticus D15-8W]
MLENPFLGVGYETFPVYYDRYYKVHDGSFLSRRKEVAHNSLVEVGATIGFPALITYLLMHLAVFRKEKRPRKFGKKSVVQDDFVLMTEIALKASIITYFVGAMFMSVAFYPYIYHLLAISIIVKRLVREGGQPNIISGPKHG